jgi:hypothetical protein
VLKRPHRIYAREEVDGILDYLITPGLARGAIPKISPDTGIPESTFAIGTVIKWPMRIRSHCPRDIHKPEY